MITHFVFECINLWVFMYFDERIKHLMKLIQKTVKCSILNINALKVSSTITVLWKKDTLFLRISAHGWKHILFWVHHPLGAYVHSWNNDTFYKINSEFSILNVYVLKVSHIITWSCYPKHRLHYTVIEKRRISAHGWKHILFWVHRPLDVYVLW